MFIPLEIWLIILDYIEEINTVISISKVSKYIKEFLYDYNYYKCKIPLVISNRNYRNYYTDNIVDINKIKKMPNFIRILDLRYSDNCNIDITKYPNINTIYTYNEYTYDNVKKSDNIIIKQFDSKRRVLEFIESQHNDISREIGWKRPEYSIITDSVSNKFDNKSVIISKNYWEFNRDLKKYKGDKYIISDYVRDNIEDVYKGGNIKKLEIFHIIERIYTRFKIKLSYKYINYRIYIDYKCNNDKYYYGYSNIKMYKVLPIKKLTIIKDIRKIITKLKNDEIINKLLTYCGTSYDIYITGSCVLDIITAEDIDYSDIDIPFTGRYDYLVRFVATIFKIVAEFGYNEVKMIKAHKYRIIGDNLKPIEIFRVSGNIDECVRLYHMECVRLYIKNMGYYNHLHLGLRLFPSFIEFIKDFTCTHSFPKFYACNPQNTIDIMYKYFTYGVGHCLNKKDMEIFTSVLKLRNCPYKIVPIYIGEDSYQV